MKIACASDIHGNWNKIQYPSADVLVIAGDTLPTLFYDSFLDANQQLTNLEILDRFFGKLINAGVYQHILLIAGNHDWCFQKLPVESRALVTNATYLQDEGINIDGVKFYGSPWQKWFWDWAFNFPDHNANFFRAREHARRCWEAIPDDVNVLITHGPPYEILDYTVRGNTSVGDQFLKDRVDDLTQLKLHVFGHIHYSYGITKRNDVTYVNASISGEDYRPINAVRIIEI